MMPVRMSIALAKLSCLVAVLLVAVQFGQQQACAQSTIKAQSNRLPRTVLPDSYRLFIEPDLVNKQYSGEETIFLTVKSATKEIVLNSIDLDIVEPELSAIVKTGHGDGLVPEVKEDKEHQRVHFLFKKTLTPGKYEFRLKFGGRLNEKLAGFYLSKFKGKGGEEKLMASTQLEPADARKVFPCFDEPDMKATFRITLSIEPGNIAISNAPVKFDKVDQRANKRQMTFEETPPMSTYLVVLVVGPFEPTPAKVVNGVQIRVWATEGNIPQGSYGLNTAAKMLPYLESYFGVPYPLKKLDLIAIPDFGPGAMENLGAITFRESRLLVDSKNASTSVKQDVAAVIAHEMAHMWFGDVVTMKWWDDLWLNEAFATWMSTKVLENFKPDWHAWDMFTAERNAALATDCLASTRSIYAPVHEPEDAEEMFDEVTYEKGASVLRMLEMYLGEETYMKGIQQYIKENKFKNAATTDLWSALQVVSGKPVTKIMKEWVYQAGYPLVEVGHGGKGKKTSTIALTQKPFTISGEQATKSKPVVWQIPVLARFLHPTEGKSSTVKSDVAYLLATPNMSCPELDGKKPFVINALAYGYYRVRYPKELLTTIAESVSHLTVAERYQLLSDSWALVDAGDMPMSEYLKFTSAYRNETDPNVINLLAAQLSTVDWFIDPGSRPQFQTFVRDRLGGLAQKLTWNRKPGETDLTSQLRSTVLQTLGTIGQDPDVIEKARKRFNAYIETPEKLDPDLCAAIANIVAFNGGSEEFELLDKARKAGKTPEEKLRNLMALGFFRKPELVDRTLALTISDEVRTQDAPHLLLEMLQITDSRDKVWKFVKENWTAMEGRYPEHIFPRIVKGTVSFVSKQQSEDLSAFLAQHPIKSGRRVVAKVTERVRLNVQINERYANELSDWLRAFNSHKSAAPG